MSLQPASTIERARRVSAAVTVLIAVSVLFGWTLGVPVLKTVLPGLTTMKANTAVGLGLAAVGLLLVSRDPGCGRNKAAALIGCLVGLLGATTLVEYESGARVLDEVLFADPGSTSMPYPGRMAPGAAMSFAALGLSIICLALARRRPLLLLAHALTVVPASIGYLSLVGYLYGVEGRYNFGPYVALALHTAFGLSLLSFVVFATRQGEGWARAFRGMPIATGVMLRLVLWSAFVPFAIGFLVVFGARLNLYQAIYGPALFALLAAGTLLTFALRAAMTVRQAETLMLDARKTVVQQARGLVAREAKFRTFAQAIPSMVWASGPDGLLEWHNQSTLDYTGASEGELDGEAWQSVVHPDDLVAAGGIWANALATGSPYETEFRVRRHDGAYRWFLVRGQPVRLEDGTIVQWVGTNTDIHEQRLGSAVLAETNVTLRREIEQRTAEHERAWRLSQELLAASDTNGRIIAVNEAWETLLGWSTDALVGTLFLDLVHPDNRDASSAVFAGIFLAPLVTPHETRVLHVDRSYKWFAWTAAFEGGKVYSSGRDITTARAAAAALAKTEDALRQSQKMEAVGQLTGGLAHDFNNLLTGVTGSLDLMRVRLRQGRVTELDRYIVAAQGAADRAAALTHRLLAFSRRQTLESKPTDANRLIAGMGDLVRRTVGPGITVEIVGAGALWTILVDQNQLENALLNLCINARDAMPDGGRITIETANKWLDERGAAEHDLPPGQYVALCVTDTGTGMPPDVIERVFDPFFTTKPLGQGTGLGLSMIYGFVRQSGGQVRIYSEVGDGTTMCLYLPRHHGAASMDTARAVKPVMARADRGETVLIVDDEPTVRMLVTEILEEAGFTAIEAGDGAAGLKVLRSDVPIDLLITDVGLPGGMNGRQVADAGRVVRPDLKVLFITGYAENAVIGNGQLEPGMRVLTKPFAMEALGGVVKEMIGSSETTG